MQEQHEHLTGIPLEVKAIKVVEEALVNDV